MNCPFFGPEATWQRPLLSFFTVGAATAVGHFVNLPFASLQGPATAGVVTSAASAKATERRNMVFFLQIDRNTMNFSIAESSRDAGVAAAYLQAAFALGSGLENSISWSSPPYFSAITSRV